MPKFLRHAAFLGLLSAALPASAADSPRAGTTLTPDGSRITIEPAAAPAPTPVFFSATAEQTVRVDSHELTGDLRLKLHVVQGRPEVLSLGLSGDGDILSITGPGLLDWSVRQDAGGQRFLDLRPVPIAATATPPDLDLAVRTRLRAPTIPGISSVLLVTGGQAVGFTSQITLRRDPSVDLRVRLATGLTRVTAASADTFQFISSGEARLELQLSPRGGAPVDAELVGAELTGRVQPASAGVEFRLRGSLRAQSAGARLRLLSGRAALADRTAGDGWHVELVALGEQRFAHDLVADREGLHALDLTFLAEARETGDWRALDFAMPAGAVVPLVLEGLAADVSFKPDAPVVPITTPQGWKGFLPADGVVSLAWKPKRAAAEGALFFTSYEQSEVRLGTGLLRQSAGLSFHILQGKLTHVRCRVEGPGEITGVEGAHVVGWKESSSDAGRFLEISFSRPIETDGALVINSQTELGSWPVRAEPMRFTPEGGVRHSGFVRIANQGAARLEVSDVAGMMQLAPAQWPGQPVEAGARQVFVYRFASATRAYRVHAAQIQPEVGLSVIATYELGETARVIDASLELDVREAPLREWSLRVPEDYTVVSLTGADVADYAAEAEAAGGTRALRVVFAKAVEGRRLLQLRLEKSTPPAAGDWTLPPLQFPAAKSVRGHVGAIATPGFRLAPLRAERLVEVPLAFFPKQVPGLQQAWRLRDAEWSAAVRVEALGQSVQADVFHLYSLKENGVVASVLLNYFVVGAPATEWRVEVPATAGNIDVVGQNVRRDWRREGDQLIVSLHQPVLGAATLLVTFEQPMSARGGVIAPGQVRPLNVQAERGYVQVVSPLQVKHGIRRLDGGLLKLEPTELPAELRLLTSAPSLAVYQYTARPFALELGVEWYAPGETVDQVVDFAQLSSRVARDGQVVTEAKFFVKTRGRKALRLVLPAGVKLWEARVDQELVNARADADQTVIPLPPRPNPNDPVAVSLRLGQPAAGSGSSVKLIAPRSASAPIVINEWVVSGDAGRQLVPGPANAELLQPALTETGFEWITQRGPVGTFILLSLIALSLLLLRSESARRLGSGLLLCALAAAGTGIMAGAALLDRRPNLAQLTFANTLVPPGDTIAVPLANVPDWQALLVSWGLAALVVGASLLVAPRLAAIRGRPFAPLLAPTGVLLLAVGLLAQHGGAVAFFAVAGVAVFFRVFVPGLQRWQQERRTENVPDLPATGGTASATLSILALACILGGVLGGAPSLSAQSKPTAVAAASAIAPTRSAALADGTRPAQSAIQSWSIRGDRVFAELEFTARGVIGDSFLLLRAPAVLTEFKADGLRVGKVERDGHAAYYVALEREGLATARVRFELPLADRTQPLALPTGPAALQRVTLELDQGGWEFTSPQAVSLAPAALGENLSGATLVLAPQGSPVLQLRPKRRDLAGESTVFFAEAANVFLPAPGGVNGLTRITIRPSQGRVSSLELVVPPGLTVGEVHTGPVGAWRFDPGQRRLHVSLEPAQTGEFAFDVETQLGAGELPFTVALEPLRVLGAASDVGLLALAFGADAQPESVRPTDLSAVNLQDLDPALVAFVQSDPVGATVQQVWRYGPAGGRVELKIAPVAPEVRVAGRQVFSLDDDRLVLSADLRVSITRVGLFKLSFPLPEGLEVEALSGPALSHWTDTQEVAQRIITLHLQGRTLGEQAFTLSLAGAAPRAQAAWPLPRLRVREATKQSGDVLVVPGKGLRLRAVDHTRVTQLDPRILGAPQLGSLGFRLLQDDWVLNLGIEQLDPWVTVQALQEVTLREGQTLTRLALRYRVENAAIKSARLRLPGLDEARARTVRATGSAVSEIVRVPDTADTWELRFQRGIGGETDVQIEFQGLATSERGQETVAMPEFVGARQIAQFAAIRSGGRLELETGALPRGWSRVDWSAVPPVLLNHGDRSVPAFCLRVAEPEGALAVTVRRHAVAEALKLRVTQGDLTTLFAPGGAFLTAVQLKVDVLEKSTLRVRLPSGAKLFNTFVNGESVSAVRDGDALLFHVSPNTAGNRTASVRLVYSATSTARGDIGLIGPGLSVPLENVTWRVVIPPGYDLSRYTGALRLREESGGASSFSVEDYRSFVSSKRTADTQEAMTLLRQASSWAAAGDQEKASQALSQVSNNVSLDAASNEDARVQLRNLKTQQTILGLNTRRQRLYLDNVGNSTRNGSLEQAATLNPFMQGKVNFNPQQVDQLLMGNTAEENTALRGIAARIVEQQLGGEPPPGALDVTLSERGRVFTFTRSLQVDGGAPLELSLGIARLSRIDWAVTAGLILALGGLIALALRRPTAQA